MESIAASFRRQGMKQEGALDPDCRERPGEWRSGKFFLDCSSVHAAASGGNFSRWKMRFVFAVTARNNERAPGRAFEEK